MEASVRPSFILIAFVVTLAVQAEPLPEFPRGTATFVKARVYDAVANPGGGIWGAGAAGLVHYTDAGAGTTYPIGESAYGLAAASDGALWFATPTRIARMAPNGTILEQYPMANVVDIAVASDGALWYARSAAQDMIGRIAGGTISEFVAPAKMGSVAPATAGDVWLLGHGFGVSPDFLHRMTAGGAVTTIPLGHDVLFGELQSLPDGTLYVGTGIRRSVLRLAPGSQTFEVIALPDWGYLADAEGNLWTGGYESLGFIGRTGTPRMEVQMPGDPRDCFNTPVYFYDLLAIDGDGGLWIRIYDDAGYLPGVPACGPIPPPMPDLIRVDTREFLMGQVAEQIPALSPMMLGLLAAGLAVAAAVHLRR